MPISSSIIQCIDQPWNEYNSLQKFSATLMHWFLIHWCWREILKRIMSSMGDQIHWIMQELMDSSRIGTNPSPMADYHWVPLKVAPMQVPTQNWQLIYTHYYVWAETTLHHLYLWNALPVQFLVLKTLVHQREGWKLWCDDLKNRAFKLALSIFIIDIIISFTPYPHFQCDWKLI